MVARGEGWGEAVTQVGSIGVLEVMCPACSVGDKNPYKGRNS